MTTPRHARGSADVPTSGSPRDPIDLASDEAVTPPAPDPGVVRDGVAASIGAIADPGPLGLSAFALTTFVLSVFNAQLITGDGLEGVVLPLALFYGGLAQLLAGMWEFKKANTFGAMAFTSFGAFWLSFAAYVKFVVPSIPESSAGQLGHVTGLYLLAWTIFTAIMLIASLRTTVAIALVFVTLEATFVLLTIGNFGGETEVVRIGGYLGLATAAAAWYAAMAGVVNATWKRTMLPVVALS